MKSNQNCRFQFPYVKNYYLNTPKEPFKPLLFVCLLILTVSLLLVYAFITEKSKKIDEIIHPEGRLFKTMIRRIEVQMI